MEACGVLKLSHEARKCDCCVVPTVSGVLSSDDFYTKKKNPSQIKMVRFCCNFINITSWCINTCIISAEGQPKTWYTRRALRGLKRLFSSKHRAKKPDECPHRDRTRSGCQCNRDAHVWATICVCLLLFCLAIMPSHVPLATLFFCVLKRRYSSVLVSTQASLEKDQRAFNKAI